MATLFRTAPECSTDSAALRASPTATSSGRSSLPASLLAAVSAAYDFWFSPAQGKEDQTAANIGRRTNFDQHYRLEEILGAGAFSTVYLAVELATGRKWACKVITEDSDRDLLLREVDILKQLQHPNLVAYREHFDEPDRLYIITERLHGRDLLSACLARGTFPEVEARDIMRQILSGLKYLSAKGIAHRDLKLENIFLVPGPDGPLVKIIDFGLAEELAKTDGGAFTTPCGTPEFVPPEVASRKPYGAECDVWAAGVVLYVMLSGHWPFKAGSIERLMQKIRAAKLDFCHPSWELVSVDGVHMVCELLTASPRERPTAEEALDHPWLCID